MKTTEEKKLTHLFKTAIIWILFFSLTATGLIYAGTKTKYMDDRTEYETVPDGPLFSIFPIGNPDKNRHPS